MWELRYKDFWETEHCAYVFFFFFSNSVCVFAFGKQYEWQKINPCVGVCCVCGLICGLIIHIRAIPSYGSHTIWSSNGCFNHVHEPKDEETIFFYCFAMLFIHICILKFIPSIILYAGRVYPIENAVRVLPIAVTHTRTTARFDLDANARTTRIHIYICSTWYRIHICTSYIYMKCMCVCMHSMYMCLCMTRTLVYAHRQVHIMYDEGVRVWKKKGRRGKLPSVSNVLEKILESKFSAYIWH